MNTDDLERREATLLARLWLKLGREDWLDIKLAYAAGEAREARELTCIIVLHGDQFAPFWRTGLDGETWWLLSVNEHGRATDWWAKVKLVEGRWIWECGPKGGTEESALECRVAVLEMMTNADD